MLKFTQKEITPEETLGDFLKKVREKQKITLDELSRKTKIRKIYLEALEKDDFNTLPYDPYGKGILKKYLTSLGIDQEYPLKLYERQKNIERYVNGKEPKKHLPPLKQHRVITPKILFITLMGGIFILILSYIIYQFYNFAAPPQLVINYPPDNITVQTDSLTVEGEVNHQIDLLINNQSIPVENDGHFKTIINLQNGVNFIKIAAKNRMNKETVVNRKVLAKIPPMVNKKESPPAYLLELTVQIGPNSAWLYIETDGQQVYQGVMLPGAYQTFKAQNYFTLTTRNAGSVEVIFNGKNIGKLGQEGESVKNLRFDKNMKIE